MNSFTSARFKLGEGQFSRSIDSISGGGTAHKLQGKKGLLFIREGGLGDILMCTPVIRALKDKFNKPVSFATKPQYFCLLEDNLSIDCVLDIGTANKLDYELVFDIRSQLEDYSIKRNRLHRIDSLACCCDVMVENYDLQCPVFKEEVPWAINWLAEQTGLGERAIIGLGPGAHFRLRSWIETYPRDLVELLPRHFFILFGNDDRYCWKHSRVALAIGLSLKKVMALLSLCRIFISVDSGLLHIAGALGIPTIAMFGSLPPELRIAYYPKVQAVVANNVPCVPCYEWQEKSKEDRDYCRDVDVRCMRAIKPWIIRNKILFLDRLLLLEERNSH